MNAHSRHQQDDERSPAVRQADAGAVAWRAVVHAQQSATSDHAELYSLAGHLVGTLAAVESLAGVLARQVAGYADSLPAGRVLYDDEDANPAHRLRAAVLALAEARHGLALAERAANQFWSAVGHIGIHYQDGDRS